MACGGETASGGTLNSVQERISGGKGVFKPQGSVRLSALEPPFLAQSVTGSLWGCRMACVDRWIVKPRLE